MLSDVINIEMWRQNRFDRVIDNEIGVCAVVQKREPVSLFHQAVAQSCYFVDKQLNINSILC